MRGTGEALGSPVHQATIKQVFTVQLYEQYIELMCVKEPTSVREYVKTKGSCFLAVKGGLFYT